jgi:hypothetical protein
MDVLLNGVSLTSTSTSRPKKLYEMITASKGVQYIDAS